MESKNYTNTVAANLNLALNTGLVGASGCLFGLLLAYGVLFPNAELMLMFIPVPIKAKWFVLGYGAIELMLAFRNAPGDNVAHFAHLGGMIFGYIIIKYWQKKGKLYSN
jgi:membrane associated rhomboid family serine protease